MNYVEHTHRGFLSRLFNSVIGVIVGIVMIPASVGLICWNEYRTVHRAKGLLEGEQIVVELPEANSATETATSNGQSSQSDKLIHTTGLATTTTTLSDPEFGISGEYLRLRREVEMFQWVERQDSKTRKKLGGGEETVRTYSYEKRWKSGRENSEGFKEAADHANPQPRFSSLSQLTERATLGTFVLRPSQVESIDSWSEVRLDPAALLERFDAETSEKFSIQGNYLYFGANKVDPASPKVGDQRIRFSVVEPTQVSVLGKPNATSIDAYQTSNGEKIDYLMVGQVSAAGMFDSLKSQNKVLAMVLRLVGWVLSIVGFALIASPLKALSDVIPFLGNLVGAATFFVALILGSCVSLVAISVAWIAVRPLYSIVLLGLVAIGVWALMRRRAKPTAPAELPLATFADGN